MGKTFKDQKTFKYFDWNEKEPIGKYKQPVITETSPDKDLDNDDIMVKGKYPTGTKKKPRVDMRGAGAAEKGKKFFPGD